MVRRRAPREFSSLPGVISGRRFKVAGDDSKPVYCAMYELSSRPDEVVAAMNAGIKQGTMHMTDALDPTSLSMTTLTPR